jgi:EAL domain-containing protein (putative c-di-GMP-specific phosphodiesterase class I)/GGDEF domain-containing protein
MEKAINEGFAFLSTLQFGEHEATSSGYYSIGKFDATTIRKHAVADEETIDSNPLSEADYKRISAQGITDENGDPLQYILSYGRFWDTDLILYSKPSTSVDGEFIVLYEKLSDFIKKIPILNLDNVILTDDDGIVVASAKEFNHDKLYSKDSPSAFSYTEFGTVKDEQNLTIDVDGVPCYLVKAPLNIPNYYMIGYINRAEIDSQIQDDNIRNIIFVILTVAFSFVGSVLVFLSYYHISRSYVNVGIGKGKYSLFVSLGGDILKKNKKFKAEFDYDTVIGSLMNNQMGVENRMGNPDIILQLIDRSGETRYLRFLSTKTMFGYRMLGTDSTSMMTVYLDALYLSNCDYLTRLPNLTQLEIDYQKACYDYPAEYFCFEYIDMMDLERYKVMFGQTFYDQLKINFAKRLNSIFNGMVYQSSDTRFIIFTKDSTITKFLTTEVDKYTSLINAPIRVDTQFLILEFKGGFCKPFLAKDKPELEDLLQHARLALNEATESAVRYIVGYYDTLMQGDSAKYANRNAIIDLIESGMLALHYQPQKHLHTGAIVGFEALTRPKSRLNMPIIDFIEHAERNGSIIELGNFVYRSAMSFAKKIENSGVIIAMNVSPVQLMQEGFVSTFLHFYRSFALKPHSIAIEITESFLMSNYNRVLRILNMLNSEGVDIHLDDFGTVYSSMLYLKKLPINTIKIDREFVKDVNLNGYSNMIIEIISRSALHLKLKCIGEGVETAEQAEALRKLGCDIIQGYYVGHALDEASALKLLGIEYTGADPSEGLELDEPPITRTLEDTMDQTTETQPSSENQTENQTETPVT